MEVVLKKRGELKWDVFHFLISGGRYKLCIRISFIMWGFTGFYMEVFAGLIWFGYGLEGEIYVSQFTQGSFDG